MHSFKLNQVLSDSSLLQVQASQEKFERKEGNMPTKPLDIINCTPEEFFHQMVIMKNIFKDTVVSDSRRQKQCITKLTKLSAGNIVVQQDFEQWTSQESQDFISNLSTMALCYDHVDWVNVGIDPRHLEVRVGNDYSASCRGNAFQTM